jgi:regulator of sigma E protease
MVYSILRVGFILLEVILIFNLLIIVHELGHFLAARWRGLQVEKFGIWFGKPIIKKTIRGVEYSLGWIPAGGFVLLPQMAPMEAMEGRANTPRTALPPVSPLDKIIVAFAGPFFSFLLALLFAVIVWVAGRPTAEAETTTTVGYVVPNEPAAEAGFKPGDKILEVDGHKVSRFSGMVNSVTWYVVRSEGDTIPFVIQRGDQTLTIRTGFTKPETRSWERRPFRQVGLQPAITPVVARIEVGSPAAAAGLRPNDQVIAVSGERLYYLQQILEWAQAHPGQAMKLTLLRDGKQLELTMEPSRPVIGSVIKNSPADVAGIRPWDQILALNDVQVYNPAEVVEQVGEAPHQPFTLRLRRGTEEISVRVLPQTPDGKKDPIIGVEFNTLASMSGIAWDAGGKMTVAHISPFEQLAVAVQSITNTLGALASPQSDIKLQHMSGPVMMMRTYYLLFESEFGWQLALWFSVVLNVNLAILNLFPLPVLDGGHIVLATVEAIRRRPLNIRVLEVLQSACAILLIGFILYVSFYDVQDMPWNANQRPRFDSPAKPAPPE